MLCTTPNLDRYFGFREAVFRLFSHGYFFGRGHGLMSAYDKAFFGPEKGLKRDFCQGLKSRSLNQGKVGPSHF